MAAGRTAPTFIVTAVPSCPGVGGAPLVSCIITNNSPLCAVEICRNRTPSNATAYFLSIFLCLYKARWCPARAEICSVLNIKYCFKINLVSFVWRRSHWPRGLRRRSAAARLPRTWVRIPPGGMDVSRECCMLSGRGLCDELIPRPQESYRLGCFVVFDLEIPWMRRPWPTGGICAKRKKFCVTVFSSSWQWTNAVRQCSWSDFPTPWLP